MLDFRLHSVYICEGGGSMLYGIASDIKCSYLARKEEEGATQWVKCYRIIKMQLYCNP